MKGIIAGIALFVLASFPRSAGAPNFTAEGVISTYILERHETMSRWLRSVGREGPKTPLEPARAVLYARILLREASERKLIAELFELVLPYCAHETGFINGTNDGNRRHPAFGIFNMQVRTAQWVCYRMKEKYTFTRAWSEKEWLERLRLDLDFQAEVGMDLIDIYLRDYQGKREKVLQALVSGPGGVTRNIRINIRAFNARRFELMQFARLLDGKELLGYG